MPEVGAVQAAGHTDLADEMPQRPLPALRAVDLLQRLEDHEAHDDVIPLSGPLITLPKMAVEVSPTFPDGRMPLYREQLGLR
ncbi:hypothetical protein GCM10017778_54450 [Streptomyces vinaceus]|nr:hypothetical protein GCM10017778_54450 [Streptomyces vinaceus]